MLHVHSAKHWRIVQNILHSEFSNIYRLFNADSRPLTGQYDTRIVSQNMWGYFGSGNDTCFDTRKFLDQLDARLD